MATPRENEMRRLFELREQLGWTLQDLAEVAGISRGTASWWAHRLRQRGGSAPGAARSARFVEVVAREETTEVRGGSTIRVRLPAGLVVEVDRGALPDEVADLVHALLVRC